LLGHARLHVTADVYAHVRPRLHRNAIEALNQALDPDQPDPEPGGWLVTYSERTQRWGTAYRILSVRQIKSEAHPRRFSLRCEVAGPYEQAVIREGEQVHGMVWYPRDKRRKR